MSNDSTSRGRKQPTPPPPYPGSGAAVSAYPYHWNKPKVAIRRQENIAEPVLTLSPLAQWIALDAKEREAAKLRLIANSDPKDIARRNYLIEKAEELHWQQLDDITKASEARKNFTQEPEIEWIAALHLLPVHLKQPLLSRYHQLRKIQIAAEQDGKRKRPATAYINGTIKRVLPRIEQVDRRNLTPSFRYFAGRERLEELLRLPELNKRDVRLLATLTAGAMDSHFIRLCDSSLSADFTPEDALKVYSAVAHEVLRLNITPPRWAALNPDGRRRGDTPYDFLPGALARLRCANWWYQQLWRYRCVWREEQLRAAGLVSRDASAFISQDGLTYQREQRRQMKEFRKAHQLVNDEGFTLDMEEVYYAGNSNPKHRRFEMMATMKGLENIAELRGDTAVWCTITCPSKYHATLKNGKPNPKWKAKTVRDSSDYLVDMFASVRKKLKRKGLYWYGIRVAEPHHDGTVHWHMMIFTRPEEQEAATAILQEFAIREDRAELGSDITPRFKAELITKEKGSPTSYIAAYIGKNLDGDPLRKPDPATGELPLDHESGKSMADTVEHAISWASLHRIRQFQFFGIPSRQAYRELRRLAEQLARKGINGRKAPRLIDPRMDDVLSAADAGCIATYILKQGGVLTPRKDHIVRTAYNEADKPNDYGECGIQIYGIWSPQAGSASRICTHEENWTRIRKTSPAGGAAARQAVDLARQGGPAAPWTRGNNCPLEQNANNSGTVFDTGKEQENINIGALGLKQRRELLMRVREMPPGQPRERRKPRPPSSAERLYMPEQQEQAAKLADFAHTLGIDLSNAALRRLMLGEIVEIEGLRYIAGFDGEIRLAPERLETRRARLRERIARLNPQQNAQE